MIRNFLEVFLSADRNLFLYINGLSGSWLDYVVAWPTFLGGNFTSMGVVLLFLVIWDRGNLLKKFPWVVLAAVLAGLLAQIVKHTIERERPYSFFYQQINEGKVKVHFMYQLLESHSFPSGHAALVFSLAVILNILYRGKLPFLYPLAFIIALSRVYTGVHFPLDVLTGSLIGVASGLLIGFFYQKSPFLKSQT